ncbi:MAG: isoprenylcysteine carboxylmethyltransferase family protein, partial [Bacteriovoracaceae bacterium]|nr:isoprenylcysteine carboxylmethyltransferase family protein [Bacteriovoracaceae bacterium]
MQNLHSLISSVHNFLAAIAQAPVNPVLYRVGIFCLEISGGILILAVLFKFWQHAKNHPALEKQKSHFFSTREMTLLVLLLVPFWFRGIGQMPITDSVAQIIYFSVGLLMMLVAVVWHIWAKVKIGHLWSDTIEIKQDHPLVTTGAYAWARHPMYASLLLWCWGLGLMFYNLATTLIVTLVMLPLMHLRAKAEEENLLKKDPQYQLYQNNVRQ